MITVYHGSNVVVREPLVGIGREDLDFGLGFYVTLLSERLDVSGERALDIFYTSRTNELLHDEHTGLYLMSDRYLVDEVIRELQGK